MRARSGFWASTSSAFPEKNGVLGAALRASAPLRCRAAAEVQRSAFSLFGGSRQVVGVVAGHYTARTGLVARAVGVRTSEGEGSGSRSEGRGRNGGREREKKSAAGGGSAGGRGALYNQFLDLLGQQGNFSLAKAAASRGTRAKAGAGGSKPGKAGQIMKKRSGGKHKNFVEAQRHFYRQCVQQNRLELALEYVETLNEGKAFEERGMGYQGLLACCVRLNALDAAVRVHSEQVELTGGSNAFAYSMLISLAGKIAARSNPGGGGGGARQKGRGEDVNPTYIHTYLGRGLCDDEEGALPGDPLARYVSHFFEMSVREGCCNVVVCNAVLDAYGRNSHCEEVFKLHQRMRGELGIAENAETFNSLMQTATRAGWYSLVFELRREMESMGIEPSERTVSIMFAAAAKAQQHARGRKGEALGDGGGALSAALQSGVANWAFTVLDSAREGGIEVNNHILSSLFSACASEGKGINRCTKLLFWHMENAGRAPGPNVNVWCSFIKLCGACGEVDLAVQVCERYCDKPLGPYVRSSLCAAIATAAAKAGAGEVEGFERYCDKAIEWHEEAGEGEGGQEMVAANALIHMLVVIGKVQQAFKAYVEMRRRGLAADATTFNSLIWGCGRVGQEQRALKVYDEMVKFGLEPDEVTYGVLLDLHATAGAPDEGMRVFIQMKEAGIVPNVRHYTSLINAYSKAGTQESVERAFLFYKVMKSAGIQATEITLSCLIDACRRASDVDRAFEIFGEIVGDLGVVPGRGTFMHLLKIGKASGRVEEALDLILALSGGRQETLDALVDALLDERLVAEALKQRSSFTSSESLVDLCLAASEDGLVVEALEIFQQLRRRKEEEQPDEHAMAACHAALTNALGTDQI